MAETPAVEGRPVQKRPHRADAVNAAEHPTEDQQVVEVVEFRGVAPLARVEGKAEPVMVKEALPGGVYNRRHHRQFMFGQLEAEAVLLDDLRRRSSGRGGKTWR